MKMLHMTLAVMLMAMASSASAQEWNTSRERFTFVDTRMTIEVEADVPGTLRVMRGGNGTVRVTSSAGEDGFSMSAMSDNTLSLNASGRGAVSFMVSVPEGVFVRVKLPGDPMAHSMGAWTAREAQTFRWGQATTRGVRGMTKALPDESQPYSRERKSFDRYSGSVNTQEPGLYTSYFGRVTPQLVTLPDPTLFKSITVRVRGEYFRVKTNRVMSQQVGDQTEIVVAPSKSGMELVLEVPPFTEDFLLKGGGEAVFWVADGRASTTCRSVTKQIAADGSRWFTFLGGPNGLGCSNRQVTAQRAETRRVCMAEGGRTGRDTDKALFVDEACVQVAEPTGAF